MSGKRKILPAMTAADYFGLLARKLPPGWIWRMQVRDSGETYGDGNQIPVTRFGRVLWGLADELAHCHGRMRAMFAESMASTATETIAEWERDLGLPFAGYPTPATLAERQALCKVQDLMKGGTQNAHFEELGSNMGVAVDVYNTSGKLLDVTHDITGASRMTCTSHCNSALVTFTDPALRYACFAWRYRPAGRSIFWR